MCADMCVDICIDMCLDIWVDVCVDICTDIRLDMCVDMCMDICVDMPEAAAQELHFRSLWTNERVPYMGLHILVTSNFRLDWHHGCEGESWELQWELQLHTTTSFRIKQAIHVLKERSDATHDRALKDALREKMCDAWAEPAVRQEIEGMWMHTFDTRVYQPGALLRRDRREWSWRNPGLVYASGPQLQFMRR